MGLRRCYCKNRGYRKKGRFVILYKYVECMRNKRRTILYTTNSSLVVNWQRQHSVSVEQEIVRDIFAFQESGRIDDCQLNMSVSPCKAVELQGLT
jgi:hypothetical protein